MAKSDFTLAFNEITETHHLTREVVVEALRQALISAFRKHSEISQAQQVEATVDPLTTQFQLFVEKEVVENDLQPNPLTEVRLAEAQGHHPQCLVGETVMMPQEAEMKDFGRIAAQTAKQVILQKIREAERKSLYEEFKDREGDLVTAQVQSVNNQQVTVTINGRTEAVLPAKEQIRGERITTHQKVQVVILEVRDGSRGPQIIVSRAHKNLLRRLLEYEVPEIYNNQVEIKSIAREPGHRSKIAVQALQPGIDPVGACVGMRGARIQNIVKALHDEKIDVIEWNSDAAEFIKKALSPAPVAAVYLEEDIDQGNTATVIVPDNSLSLAIGREGQNARLAAKLTGWRIDIKSLSEAALAAYEALDTSEALAALSRDVEMVAEVTRIMEKKRAERPVQPEEYTTLTRFVQRAEQAMVDARDHIRAGRRKAFDNVKVAVPKHAFTMTLEELELEKDILHVLKNRNILTVSDLMVRLAAEPEILRAAFEASKIPDEPMEAIDAAISSLVLSRTPPTEELIEIEAVATEMAAEPTAPITLVETEAALVAEAPTPEAEEEAPPAFVDEEPAAKRFTPPPNSRLARMFGGAGQAAQPP
ncbi:MAG TPA: transcription termination factor NusA, partial [Aggregatilineales bacterium]|nr:transcription termination factor NusA [Aggregatilineales bacterium]